MHESVSQTHDCTVQFWATWHSGNIVFNFCLNVFGDSDSLCSRSTDGRVFHILWANRKQNSATYRKSADSSNLHCASTECVQLPRRRSFFSRMQSSHEHLYLPGRQKDTQRKRIYKLTYEGYEEAPWTMDVNETLKPETETEPSIAFSTRRDRDLSKVRLETISNRDYIPALNTASHKDVLKLVGRGCLELTWLLQHRAPDTVSTISSVYSLVYILSLIHIWRCRRSTLCRSRWSPYH